MHFFPIFYLSPKPHARETKSICAYCRMQIDIDIGFRKILTVVGKLSPLRRVFLFHKICSCFPLFSFILSLERQALLISLSTDSYCDERCIKGKTPEALAIILCDHTIRKSRVELPCGSQYR